jgi:hypothetical protein
MKTAIKYLSAKAPLNDDAIEMIELMFKRANAGDPSNPNNLDELFMDCISRFVSDNLDLLSEKEREKYRKKQIIFQ